MVNYPESLIASMFLFSGLTLGIISTLLCVILFIFSKTKVHKLWLYFNLSVAWWGFGSYFIALARNEIEAVLCWRFAYLGVLFISVFFYHFSCVLCNLKRPFLIYLAYIQAVFFAALTIIPSSISLISSTYQLKGSTLFYLESSGFIYNSSLFVWIALVFLGFAETILKYFSEPSNFRKTQYLYLFVGFFVGFSGGLSNFLLVYKINFLPIGNFTISFYCIIATYAILRYKLLDFKVALTRATVFLVVYSIILGFPFWVGFKLLSTGLWLIPTGLCALLASIGPFIYIYLQKKTEDRILQEQRAYQSTLRKASFGMSQIKDIKKLLQLIVHVVTRSVRIEHCEIYLYHLESKSYILKASKGNFKNSESNSSLKLENSLIQHIVKNKEPIVYEEISHRAKDIPNSIWTNLEASMKFLDAALIVPSFIDQQLIALFVLGSKKSNKVYSDDDLVVFSILANQSAIAIENAVSYENMIVYQKKVSEAEKNKQFNAMVQGTAHQMNNRLHAMAMITYDKLDDIKLSRNPAWEPEILILIDSLDNGLQKIKANITQQTNIVQGFMKLSKYNNPVEFLPYNLRVLLAEAIRMARTKQDNLRDIQLIINVPKKLPLLKGDTTLLTEAFFNLIDNAYDSIDEKRSFLKDPSFVGRIELTTIVKTDQIIITFSDNGMGVKEENKIKFFAPMWTTKVSSRKGNGFGLFVIKTVFMKHGGEIGFISKYLEGITFTITLPIYLTNSETVQNHYENK